MLKTSTESVGPTHHQKLHQRKASVSSIQLANVGQLWVESIYPFPTFPIQLNRLNNGVSWKFTAEVSSENKLFLSIFRIATFSSYRMSSILAHRST